jgi:hypothetical protein
MFAKLVAELKVIVAEIKSPFSYIHDKVVEALAEVHKEVEALKAKIDAIESHVGIAPSFAEPVPVAPVVAEVPKLVPTEVVSLPDPVPAPEAPKPTA